MDREIKDLEHDRKFKIMLAREVVAVANFQSSKMALRQVPSFEWGA
jgi:hypothetical protein